MILFKRRYCRKHGHDLNPDPGDFVLHCLRCQAMVDMFDLLPAEAKQCSGCSHRPHEGRPCGAICIIDGCPCPGPRTELA